MSWATAKLDQLCDVQIGRTPSRADKRFWDGGTHPWASISDISRDRELTSTKESVTEKALSATKIRIVPAGTVLMSFKLSIGKVAIARIDTCTNEAIAALHIKDPRKLDRDYLARALESLNFQDAGDRAAKGKTLNKKSLAKLEIPLPPLVEQKRIAAILDQADELRRKRQRAIDRFNQLALAIFQDMFGSDAEYVALGTVCNVSSGSTPSRENSAYYSGVIPWVKTGEVNGTRIRATSEHISEEAMCASRLKLYPPGTVLLAMYGQGKTRGQVGVLEIPATTNQACAAITCSEEIISDFLFLQLKMKYDSIRAMGRGGNQPNLNAKLVKDIPIIVPALERQRQFVERLKQSEIVEQNYISDIVVMDRLFSALQNRAFEGEL